MAALVRLAIHEFGGPLADLPGELLTLTGVASRRRPPRVTLAWVVEERARSQPRLFALPNVISEPKALAHEPERLTEPTSTKSHLEIEWQFDARDLLGVETALFGRPSGLEPELVPGPVLAIEDRYIDTADLRLLRAGYACRLRSSEAGRELTLKATAIVSKGPQQRTERTQKMAAGESLDTALSGGEMGDLIHIIVGRRPLISLFEVHTNRRTFVVTVDDVPTGEISLDRTTITPDGEGELVRLRRVEVEASSSANAQSLESLRTFATTLRKQHHLHWGKQSKFELGLQAGNWLRRGAIDLGPTEIRPDATIGDLALAVIRRHLTELLYHEPGARLGDDSEALHAMRVANRRLRADLRLFDGVLPDSWDAIDTELRWLGTVLGSVRDLDIQLGRIDSWIGENMDGELEGLSEIRTRLEASRREARAALLGALDSSRYDNLIEQLCSSLRIKLDPSSRSNWPASIAGATLLLNLERKVRRGAIGLEPESDPERFHDLRIDCKRFRYGLEAFAPLYGKPAERLIGRLTALQDLLGQHQDATIAAAELQSLSQNGSLPRSTSFTLGRLAERSLAEAAQLRGAFPAIYQPLTSVTWVKLQRRLRRCANLAHSIQDTTEA